MVNNLSTHAQKIARPLIFSGGRSKNPPSYFLLLVFITTVQYTEIGNSYMQIRIAFIP